MTLNKFQGTGVTRDNKTGDWVLHILGDVICEWSGAEKPNETNLLLAAFEAGKQKRSDEIRKHL